MPDPTDPADPRDETRSPPASADPVAEVPTGPPAPVGPHEEAPAPIGPPPPVSAHAGADASAPLPEPTPEEARVRQAVEAALALLNGAASRLSAAAGGIRFSTLQKHQGSLAYEWRQLRAQAPDVAATQALLANIERVIASIAPTQRSQGDAAVGVSQGALRQALVRGMITLAPAPLHLQIEVAPEFPGAEADPLVLAARSHAVNRTALGSLRRIQWDTPDRCTLAFGDGEQRRSLVANFDAEGKLDLPPEFRQNQPRPASKPEPGASGSKPGGSDRRAGAWSGQPGTGPRQQHKQARPGGESGPKPPGSERRAGRAGGDANRPGSRDGQARGNDRPPQQRPQNAPGENRPPQPRAPGDQNRPPQPRPTGDQNRSPRQRAPGSDNRERSGEGRDRRDGRDGRDGRRGRDGRSDTDPRDAFSARRPSFPKNTALAEKLRAALGPLAPSPAAREAPRTRPDERPKPPAGERPRRDGPSPERPERPERQVGLEGQEALKGPEGRERPGTTAGPGEDAAANTAVADSPGRSPPDDGAPDKPGAGS